MPLNNLALSSCKWPLPAGPHRKRASPYLVPLFLVSLAAPCLAQQLPDGGFKSVGRGAPLAVALHPPGPPPSGIPSPADLEQGLKAISALPIVGPLKLGLPIPNAPPRSSSSPPATAPRPKA
ncbi:MAG: hypothetical protein WDO56_25455 [Gammaproteobacteria bacterium]